jgi:UDP:flavonoid glycosyltransferase YjiC (YdhE family)
MTGTSAATWTRARNRRRRALYISSPIGLGHAQRDVAIAAELRVLHPDLEIDWLAQHPVTAVLEAHGERIHPRSAGLASESAHITAESSEHDLNAFQAIRRMDEILVSNFMVFHDTVTDGEYDLVIGDESWEVDHHLHENPELKRTAFAWMTDFVGWLPMPAGGEREAFVTADYNADTIELVERYPRIRDRAIFVGEPDDIVPDDFGPGLPNIRDWTERHFEFSGYITGFDPAPLVEGREALRRELGFQPDERVVIVTVGGSGVGEALLRRVIASFPDAARRVNGLRMIAVAGPRIDPSTLGASAGVEVRAYVPDLYRHLAACDLAVVQGGLTTTMELAAARRPFLYFPLENHFEQNRHVVQRLERYGAGRRMAYATSTPETIAAAIAAEIDRRRYRPGAGRAARATALIAPPSDAGARRSRAGRRRSAGVPPMTFATASSAKPATRGVSQLTGPVASKGSGTAPSVRPSRRARPARSTAASACVEAASSPPQASAESDADDAAGLSDAALRRSGSGVVGDAAGRCGRRRRAASPSRGRHRRGRRGMGHVEQHAARLHPAHHLAAQGRQPALRDAVRGTAEHGVGQVGRRDHPEAGVGEHLDVGRVAIERGRPLDRQQAGCARRARRPGGEVRRQACPGLDQPEVPPIALELAPAPPCAGRGRGCSARSGEASAGRGRS